MVIAYFPIYQSTSQYLVYTFVIPPNWGSSNKSITITVPVGAIMAGSSSAGTISMSGIGALSATVLQNGVSFPTTGFTLANASATVTKSFTITTSNTAYSAYSYFNTYSFTFTPTQSSTTTYTYTCYLNITAPNNLASTGAVYNCTNPNTAAYVPSNYGIVVNPVSSTSTFTNCAYLTGSANTSGYLAYGYIVNNASFTPPTTYNGYAVFDSVYCNKMNMTKSLNVNVPTTIYGSAILTTPINYFYLIDGNAGTCGISINSTSSTPGCVIMFRVINVYINTLTFRNVNGLIYSAANFNQQSIFTNPNPTQIFFKFVQATATDWYQLI